MIQISLVFRILRALFRSGLLSISWRLWPSIFAAWRRCGPSFAWLCEVAALRFPGAVALEDELGTLDFRSLWSAVRRQAAAIQGEGLGPGHTLALICPNGRHFVVGLVAGLHSGANVLPLAVRTPIERLTVLIREQRVSAAFTSESLARVMREALPETKVLTPTDQSAEHCTQRPGGHLVVLTSGSSGVSKGIDRRPTLASLLPVTCGLLESLPLSLSQPVVLAIPLYHGYGIATLAMSLALGSRLILSERYEIDTMVCGVTPSTEAVLVSVPTLLLRWMRSLGDQDATPLKAVITGSAPLSESLCRELLAKLGPILYNLYGSTEAGLIALATPADLQISPGSVGHPLPGNQVRIVEGGSSVAPGRWGTIEVSGPLVVGPQADGWYNTADVGRWEPTGFLRVSGRADSMVVSGGENVYPHELEDCLSSHPEVAECAVLAIPDEEFGQRLVAVLVTTEPSKLDETGLRAWLNPRLERHKHPKTLYFLGSLPRNALGKVAQAELRESLNLE